jgi:AcrR family transcriptional regulator
MKRARTESSKDDRRQFILDCAEYIVANDGLDDLSIAKVGKKSNLSIGTIYLYFQNKEDIIAHLTLKSRQILLQKFNKSIENETDALIQVSKFIYSYFQFYKEYPYFNQIISYYESNTGLEEPEFLKLASIDITNFVIRVLKNGKMQGVISQDLDELQTSFIIWGTAVGIMQLIAVKKDVLEISLKTTEADFFNSYIKLIIKSLI